MVSPQASPCRTPLLTQLQADFAQSEALVSADKSLCPNPGPELVKLIRADFTTCGLPEDSLSPARCVQGIENEPENCGFGDSTYGLCVYCSTGGTNGTDSCCGNSDAEKRCEDVELPPNLPTMTFDDLPSETGNPDDNDDEGLSGGAIAGIVIGSIVGVLALAGLLYMGFILLRRRQQTGSANGSVFNQPSPARRGPSMSKLGAGAPSG